jgi:pyruvate formate lyase activating enzyme
MKSSENDLVATILEIQRMSTEDGPGLRTTVFFKGCSLKCAWCHNPESIRKKIQLQWIGNRCIGCHICLETCPNHLLSFDEQGLVMDREHCQACGKCVEACPSTALEALGKIWRLSDLIREVKKDKAYFDQSGGGVTISGGEPTLQPKFAAALLKGLKEQGVQTALDTCGLCSKDALELILPYTTMVLFDLKEIDPIRHQRFTGGSLETILDNLLFIREMMRSHVHPKTLWIRTPIIPGITDRSETITGIGRFLAKHLKGTLERWELCAFNNLCREKYQRLGLKWEFADQPLLTETNMNRLLTVARTTGIPPDRVLWSGSTQLNEKQVTTL